MSHPLHGVRALLFDVFGTVVDWHGAIVAALAAQAQGTPFHALDWDAFAYEWRAGYIRTTAHVAHGAQGPATVDLMHREVRTSLPLVPSNAAQLLDDMLASPRWSPLAPLWDDAARNVLVLAWHHLRPWEDTTPALRALKSHLIIGTLSNGNIRLLVDMAKFADLPWDIVLSSELFASYKPNPAVYNGALRLLALPAHSVALVASHIRDCAGAKACGLKSVYIPRPTEDRSIPVDLSNADIVVTDFAELASIVASLDTPSKL
ncbi:haloacid dehalogenase [Ramaria rubella]|nr:haloacid dehalogenase [Ramaria rubella]